MKLLLLLTTFCAFSAHSQSECPTTVHSGIATNYTAGSSACSFPPDEYTLHYAAVNPVDFDTSAICGACLEVSGGIGIDTVYVIDIYPSASAGDLDLSQAAFEATIGPVVIGIGNVSWKVVSCPFLISENLELTNAGSNPYYLNFVIHKHVNPIVSVEIYDGSWKALTRQSFNSWVNEEFTVNNLTTANVRVTDIFGEQITIPNVDMTQTSTSYSSSENFTACISSSNEIYQNEVSDIKFYFTPESVTLISQEAVTGVYISDLCGKKIITENMSGELNQFTIPLSKINSGTYCLIIEYEAGHQTGKVFYHQ